MDFLISVVLRRSIFHWIDEGCFGDLRSFRQTYERPIQKASASDASIEDQYEVMSSSACTTSPGIVHTGTVKLFLPYSASHCELIIFFRKRPCECQLNNRVSS